MAAGETVKGAQKILDAYEKSNNPVFSFFNMIGSIMGRANRQGSTTMNAVANDGLEGLWKSVKDDKGDYSFGKIGLAAGGVYMGGSTVGRIASGGGIYKDADGNTDIIGLPFI